jgi:DnaK suppressor protein
MDIKHFQQKLLAKQRELQASLAAFEAEESAAGDAGVGDSTDDATLSQGTSEAFAEGTIVSQTLEDVEDALQRIKDGTYGKCTVCGREIEPARLEAIPWAAYCLEDQEKQDKAQASGHEGATL